MLTVITCTLERSAASCYAYQLSNVDSFLSRHRLSVWRLQPQCQAFQLALLYQHLRPPQVSQPLTLSRLHRLPQLPLHPLRPQLLLPNPLPNPRPNPPPNPHPLTMTMMRTATTTMMTTMMLTTRISPGATSKPALTPPRSRFPLRFSHIIFSILSRVKHFETPTPSHQHNKANLEKESCSKSRSGISWPKSLLVLSLRTYVVFLGGGVGSWSYTSPLTIQDFAIPFVTSATLRLPGMH